MAEIRVSIENRGTQIELRGGMDRVGFGDALAESQAADIFIRAATAAGLDMAKLMTDLHQRITYGPL